MCEVNVSDIENLKDLIERVQIAAFFGTLQAGFTEFHYLRPIWQKTTEKDALLGIGMTGIGSGNVLKVSMNLVKAAEAAKQVNREISKIIGINEAARLTCVKPSGTTSCVLGTSSGVHAWHAPYYLRTLRFNKNEEIAQYLMTKHPELCEDDILRPKDTVCVRFPIKAPKNAIMRTESALTTLQRVKHISQTWIKAGHIDGANTHNVSATISIRQGMEWYNVGDWMWNNRDFYNGISVLPYDGGSYVQAPFQDIDAEEYGRRLAFLKEIDLTKVMEMDDNVHFGQVAACSGGACTLE